MLCIGERLQGHFRVSRKLVQRLGSQLQSDSGKRRRRRRRRMETESPQGLNLHPAKQPRTTLFDWLPAGLPSVPTHERTYTDRSMFLFSLVSFFVGVLFFVSSVSFSLSLVILFLWDCPSLLSLFLSILGHLARH